MSSSTSFSLKILTAFIGSPTYFGLPNFTVFTSPLSWTSRHGMILGLNMIDKSPLGESHLRCRPRHQYGNSLCNGALGSFNGRMFRRRAVFSHQTGSKVLQELDPGLMAF